MTRGIWAEYVRESCLHASAADQSMTQNRLAARNRWGFDYQLSVSGLRASPAVLAALRFPDHEC